MSFRTMAGAALIAIAAWQTASTQPGSTATISTPSERRLQMSERNSDHPARHTRSASPVHTQATAKITVQSSKAEPYDQSAGPTLVELRLTERFTGDIEGDSPVRALQVQHADKSASLVSVQRFHGKLGGRAGSFVLQASETVEKGRITAKWFVVPGSGTGELSGLRGEDGFEGEFGKGSNGTLDYWFE